MPKRTVYMRAADKAQGHLLRGFDMAWEKHGRVRLGHDVLDPRTMASAGLGVTNIAVNLLGETAGLPLFSGGGGTLSRKVYQRKGQANKPEGPGQTTKNKLAGVVVDPTRIEMHTGTEPTSIDTAGGYGILPTNG